MSIAKELFNHVRSNGRSFKYRDGFVILEDVTIGVCDTCGNRYYSTDIPYAVHAFANRAKAPERTEQIPVTPLKLA